MDEYYQYLSGWHKEVNNLTQSLVAEVYALPPEFFGLDVEDETYCQDKLEKARFFEINARRDKLYPPYHFYRERMEEENKRDGVGFVNANNGSREDVKKSWVEAGTAAVDGEGLVISYTDEREDKFVRFSDLKKKSYGYTGVLANVRTNFFDKGDKFIVNELK